jgi:hypothetical protein
MGNGACRIIEFEVEDEGKCRFAVIPDGVVDVGVLEGEKLGRDIQSLEELQQIAEEYRFEQELAVEILPEEEYDSPEHAILSLAEFSGFGYEAEHAVRAAWLRGVRSGDDPFKRASNFATLGYESLDSDLLPKKGEDNV